MQYKTIQVYNKKGNPIVINEGDFDKNYHSKNKPTKSSSKSSTSKKSTKKSSGSKLSS